VPTPVAVPTARGDVRNEDADRAFVGVVSLEETNEGMIRPLIFYWRNVITIINGYNNGGGYGRNKQKLSCCCVPPKLM
jgi:hypothetical protein